jgi:diamine N-acetyltransferase
MLWLENEVIKLRALEPEDLEYLYRWENDSMLWEYGNTCSPFSKHILRRYLEKASLNIFETRQIRLMIELKGNKLPIGTLDVYDFEPFHLRASVGILIDAPYRRQGYAQMALDIVKMYGFDFLKLHQLYAYIPADNVPSLHLFRQAGFEETGLLRQWNRTPDGFKDVFVYQLIEPEKTKNK